MREHTRRALAILLGVCFLVSLTATAVSAQCTYLSHYDQTWGPVSKQNYNNAYINAESAGTADGQNYGARDGTNDCRTGALDNSANSVNKYFKSTSFTSAAALGAVDGYNDYFCYNYITSYRQAYNECINAGQQNAQIRRMG